LVKQHALVWERNYYHTYILFRTSNPLVIYKGSYAHYVRAHQVHDNFPKPNEVNHSQLFEKSSKALIQVVAIVQVLWLITSTSKHYQGWSIGVTSQLTVTPNDHYNVKPPTSEAFWGTPFHFFGEPCKKLVMELCGGGLHSDKSMKNCWC